MSDFPNILILLFCVISIIILAGLEMTLHIILSSLVNALMSNSARGQQRKKEPVKKNEKSVSLSPEEIEFRLFLQKVRRYSFDPVTSNSYAFISGTDKMGRKTYTVARFPNLAAFSQDSLECFFVRQMGSLVCSIPFSYQSDFLLFHRFSQNLLLL